MSSPMKSRTCWPSAPHLHRSGGQTLLMSCPWLIARTALSLPQAVLHQPEETLSRLMLTQMELGLMSFPSSSLYAGASSVACSEGVRSAMARYGSGTIA